MGPEGEREAELKWEKEKNQGKNSGGDERPVPDIVLLTGQRHLNYPLFLASF